MKFKIISRRDNTKEAIESEKERDRLYWERIETVANSLPNNLAISEKLKILYLFMVNNMSYDYDLLNDVDENGFVTPQIFSDSDQSEIPDCYKDIGTSGEKRSAFIHHKSVCRANAEIFCDLCTKSGIECQICTGLTGPSENNPNVRVRHVWNTILDENGIPLNVDVTYGIFVKDGHKFINCEGRNILDFCCITDEELSKIGPHTKDDNIIDSMISKK